MFARVHVGAQVSQLGGWPILTLGNSQIVVDLNGDGSPDIVVPGVFLPPYSVLAFDATGMPLSGWNAPSTYISPDLVRVGDVTGDGLPEVLYAYNNINLVYVVNHAGAAVPPFPLDLSIHWPGAGSGINALVLADVVPGGGLEIIAANDSWSFDPESTIVVYSGDGVSLPGWPKTLPGFCSIAADDLDGDALADIVIATRNYCSCGDAPCYAFRGDGTALPGWPVIPGAAPTERSLWRPVIADMDGDGSKEIVGATESMVFMHRSDGTEFRPPRGMLSHPRQVAVADLDGDGRREVILTGTVPHIIDIDAGNIANGPTTGSLDYTSLAVADIDGDGSAEIVSISIYPVPANPWHHELHIFDRFLNRLPGWPISTGTGSGSIIEPVTIEDLDGDGDLEIVYSSSPQGVLAYDLPNPSGNRLWVQWRSYENDPAGSSSAHSIPGPYFLRGDANRDGQVDISDAISVLAWQFLGAAGPQGCRDAADANDDGQLNIADPVYLLVGLFGAGPATIATACARDDTADGMECMGYWNCPL